MIQVTTQVGFKIYGILSSINRITELAPNHYTYYYIDTTASAPSDEDDDEVMESEPQRDTSNSSSAIMHNDRTTTSSNNPRFESTSDGVPSISKLNGSEKSNNRLENDKNEVCKETLRDEGSNYNLENEWELANSKLHQLRRIILEELLQYLPRLRNIGKK